MVNNSDGFIVDKAISLFDKLEKISIFYFVRKYLKRCLKVYSYSFVELWVIGNLVASILLSNLIYNANIEIINYIALVYGALRVFEIIVCQINIVFFDRLKSEKSNEPYFVKSIVRSLILIFINFLEIVFWYVCMIISISRINNIDINYSWIRYVGESFLCLSTLSEGSITESYSLLRKLAFFEIITGLVFTLVSFARFLGLLPAVDELSSKDLNNTKLNNINSGQYINIEDNSLTINIVLNEDDLEKIKNLNNNLNIKLELNKKKDLK